MTDTEKAALERRIDELCAEVEAEKQRNAKLFKAAEKWMAKAAHYEAENDKLRELVRDMWICVEHDSSGDCTGCRRDPDHVCISGISEFYHRMAELGIEVPE